MAIRLQCEEVKLAKTPTHISYLCYYAEFGKRPKVSHWETILEKYLLWWRHSLLNENLAPKAYKKLVLHYDAHVKELREAAKKYRRLNFSIG